MVAPQMLGQVVRPSKAARTDTATLVNGAVDVFRCVCRLDVSADVCFAAERANIAVPVKALWVVAIVPFPVRVVCQLGGSRGVKTLMR
jgi:hypothetical protein